MSAIFIFGPDLSIDSKNRKEILPKEDIRQKKGIEEMGKVLRFPFEKRKYLELLPKRGRPVDLMMKFRLSGWDFFSL